MSCDGAVVESRQLSRRDRIITRCADGARCLSRNQSLLNLVRSLHLKQLMKLLYFEISVPKNHQKILILGHNMAKFHVIDYEELRAVEAFEAALNTSMSGEERMLRAIIAKIRPGDVVYDVGASIGIHTVFTAAKVGERGRVVSFEPEKKAYEALQRNVRLNGLKNVKVVNVALGSKRGLGRLYNTPKIGMGASSLLETGDCEFRQKVEIWPGDCIRENEDLPIPRVVKIDVEGVEFDVIKGLKKTLSQKECHLVCCEVHPGRSRVEQRCAKVTSLLASLGFRKTKIFRRGGEIHSFCYKT